MNHGGTPEENQAIVDALHGLDILRKEVAAWQIGAGGLAGSQPSLFSSLQSSRRRSFLSAYPSISSGDIGCVSPDVSFSNARCLIQKA